MDLRPQNPAPSPRAFTLVEVLVSLSIVGIMFVSLYGGISSGYAIVNETRHNLRASQILLEKMEIIRLYTWDQLTDPSFVPATFSEPLDPDVSSEHGEEVVPFFFGTVTITNAPVADEYADKMRAVMVSLVWTNGSVPRIRTTETLVGENGLQSYVY